MVVVVRIDLIRILRKWRAAGKTRPAHCAVGNI